MGKQIRAGRRHHMFTEKNLVQGDAIAQEKRRKQSLTQRWLNHTVCCYNPNKVHDY